MGEMHEMCSGNSPRTRPVTTFAVFVPFVMIENSSIFYKFGGNKMKGKSLITFLHRKNRMPLAWMQSVTIDLAARPWQDEDKDGGGVCCRAISGRAFHRLRSHNCSFWSRNGTIGCCKVRDRIIQSWVILETVATLPHGRLNCELFTAKQRARFE